MEGKSSIAAMEVSTPVQDGARRADSGGGCFPLRCFGCCPSSVKMFIPSTWTEIQDWTHLALVLGVVASFVLVGRTVFDLVMSWKCSSWFCIQEILALLFIFPCMLYFVRIIGQYDDRLQSKQRDAKEQKEQLTKAYNTLLADMDGLLTKSAESSAGLAERSFESKRRDFQRFLERAKSRYSNIFAGNKAENDKLMENFRQFVLNWLRVFEECSIDPIKCPKRVVTAEELQRCMTVGEVCDLTLERLRITEVRFISIQRDQDAQMLRKTRNDFRRLTAPPTALDARTLAALENGTYEGSTGGGRPLTTELNPGTGSTGRRCSWCSFGGGGCKCVNSQTPDGFPKEIGCVCCRLVMLSREHAMLLTGFLVGWAIMLLEVLSASNDVDDAGNRKPNSEQRAIIDPFLFVQIGLIQICLMVLLIRFEELDVIQQLEREVAELKKAEQNVQQQREKMQEFWSQAQQLTELWLYRTVPRLDLYKEVHSHLEDAPFEDLNDWMDKANKMLTLIDDNLGELGDWRNEGTLSLDNKKSFGKNINQICQEQEFEHIRNKIEQKAFIKCLEAPAPGGDSPKKNIAPAISGTKSGPGGLMNMFSTK